MSAAPMLEALPLEKQPLPAASAQAVGFFTSFFSFVRAVGGWAWRLAVGPLLCMNYFTAVIVVGWLTRHMQAVAVQWWWWQSRSRRHGSFAEFCAAVGPDAPRARTSWFLRERPSAALAAPMLGGQAPDFFAKAWRALGLPFHSLWLNLTLGFKGILGTFMLVGWGCLLMSFSWLFGWHNSFNKGYEIAFLGPVTGFTGLLLFIAAMYYVPMAQAHFAMTGELRAFLDFRFVWKLVRARLFAYTALIAMTGLAFIPLEIMVVSPKYLEQINPGFYELSAADYEKFLNQYFWFASAYLFIALLVLRHLAARIYASAVLAVLRRGDVLRSELHPKIDSWLDRLDVDVMPILPGGVFAEVVKKGGGWVSRRILFTFIFVVWFLVISLVYVREFLHYHPYLGFFNHALIQVPCAKPPYAVEPPLPANTTRP